MLGFGEQEIGSRCLQEQSQEISEGYNGTKAGKDKKVWVSVCALSRLCFLILDKTLKLY